MYRIRVLPLLAAVGTAVTFAMQVPASPLLPTPAASTAPLPVGQSSGWSPLFADEFDGTALNTSKWHTCFWWATTTCSIESNSEQELYTADNVSVANGVLRLQARNAQAVGWNGKTYAYTSGMISSGGRKDKIPPGFTFKYGYVEAKVKVPTGQGLWPGFWLLPANYGSRPEIDVMEILGQRPNFDYMNYHYLKADGTNGDVGSSWGGPDFSAGWHTFAVDWEPDAMIWYVDGVERWRNTDRATISSEPSYILLNQAVGGNWPGAPSAGTIFPSDYLVDYVRVWSKDRLAPPTLPAITSQMSVNPVADTFVDGTYPANAYGSSPELSVDGDPSKISFLKFDLSSLAGAKVTSASLRMKVTNTSTDYQTVRSVADSSWTEAGVTYTAHPALGTIVGTIKGATTLGGIVSVDLTASVQASAGALLSLGIDSTQPDGFGFSSREAVVVGDRPTLLITTA